MPDYPNTKVAFHECFGSEEACRAQLVRVRWPSGPACPRCGNDKITTSPSLAYWCGRCRYTFTVLSKSLFADTHKPLKLWFEAIWHIANQWSGTSAVEIQHLLGLGSYRTAWTWLHKLRRAMVHPGRDQLSGIVELTEAHIGARARDKVSRDAGRPSLVLIAVQAAGLKAGRIRLMRIADTSAGSLEPAVVEALRPGTRVLTHDLPGYGGLRALGYDHGVIRAPITPGKSPLSRAAQTVRILQRWLHFTHQDGVQASHLDYYLDEFTFRFNRWRTASPWQRFSRLLHGAVTMQPVIYETLVGGNRAQTLSASIDY